MTITQTITALPTAPDRSDSSTFSDRADVFLASLPGMVTEENTFGTQANALAVTVNSAKDDAESAESVAVAAANFKGLWSALTGAAAIPYSVYHDSKYWMLNTGLADVTAKEPGVDVEWTQIGNAKVGANADITSMTGLSDDGIPGAKVVSSLLHSYAVADLTDTATPSVLTTAETTNTVVSNYKSSGADHVFTMCAAHAAGNVMFVIGDEFQVDIEPDSGDLFYLNGTAMAADEHIQNTADTLGETITGVCANINGTMRWMFYSAFSNFVEETP